MVRTADIKSLKRGMFLFSHPLSKKSPRESFRHCRQVKEFGIDSVVVDAETEYDQFPKLVDDFKPDFLAISRRCQFLPLLRIITIEHPEIVIVGMFPDVRHHVKEYGQKVIDFYDLCDVIFVKTRGSIDDWKNNLKSCRNIIWWPQGVELETWKHARPNQEILNKYNHDVIFMGAKRGYPYTTPEPGGRIRLIQHIKNKGIDLKLVAYNEQGSGKISGYEWNAACNTAKIVLGHCGLADVSCSNSQRDYRVIASGGFLLTEHVLDCELLFKPGIEIATYTTADDCVDKIRYYLEHEEERKVIQDAGYESRVRHDIMGRFKTFLEIVDKIHREKNNI